MSKIKNARNNREEDIPSMKHRITAILTLCVLLCSTVLWAHPAQGATTPVSLTVEYLYDETPVVNVEIDIYLVATWINGDFY